MEHLGVAGRQQQPGVRCDRGLVTKDGDLPAAATAYAEAAHLATNLAERDHLVRQAARVRRRAG